MSWSGIAPAPPSARRACATCASPTSASACRRRSSRCASRCSRSSSSSRSSRLSAAKELGIDEEGVPFHVKKEVTSALRRLAPTGLSTDIVWTANARTLRHVIEMRTAEGAEEELRLVFDKIARIMQAEAPGPLPGLHPPRRRLLGARAPQGLRPAARGGAARGGAAGGGARTRAAWASRVHRAGAPGAERQERGAAQAAGDGSAAGPATSASIVRVRRAPTSHRR